MIHKKLSVLLGAMALTTMVYAQQPQTGTPGNSSDWRRGGNLAAPPGLGGTNNIFGTMWNSPIYTVTNGINRMVLMGTNPAGSITGALGLGTALPNSYLHLSNFGNGAFDPIGRMFRTEGLNTFQNHWSMRTGTAAVNTLERFRISTRAGAVAMNEVELGTVQDGSLSFLTNNVERVTVLGANPLPDLSYERGGFVGLNNSSPMFHLDINTPEPDGNTIRGELLLRARIVDDPDAYIGFLNISTTGNLFVPTLFAHQSVNQVAGALTTLGTIDNAQDLAANAVAVTRFISGRNYDPATDPGTLGLQRANVIQNRRIFTWNNAVDVLMTMEANGFLGIGINNPGNRVEINSDFYNAGGVPFLPAAAPTFASANGAPGIAGPATGFSGLRLTDLRSNSVPRSTNPGDGVLALDENGDVIYVQETTSGSSAPCGSQPALGALNSNHRINLNNHNYYFLNMQPAVNVNPTFNKVAIGYDCDVSLPAKFNVFQQEATPINYITWGTYVQNRDAGTILGLDYVGMKSVCNGLQTIPRNTNTGGEFSAFNAQRNIGVYGTAYPGAWTNTAQGTNCYGGYFTSAPLGSEGVSWGIYARGGNPASNVRAGFFSGAVESTNYVITASDEQFKDSVLAIDGGLKTITLLKPVKYKFDISGYPQFNFATEQQYGFIAQQVQNVIPALVHDSYMPAELDSLGDTITPAVSYKSLNYSAFIPINTQAIIELNQKVERATLSDQSIKTNVLDLNGSLDKVLEMRGVSYNWDHSVHPELNLDSANHVGFIAQEIQQIDSRLTYIAEDSLLHVEYDKVVPILAEAIQELNTEVESKDSIITVLTTENLAQQTTIDDLNTRLTNLENCLSALLPTLCSMNQSLIQNNTPAQQEAVRKNLNVTLSDRNAIVLDQNVPNPFAEQTVINFSIPATVVKAQIHFYDGNGKLMQSVEVTERGLGSLTVFGSDLSTGVYTYTLVADGQIVATKKMMKQ